MLKNTVGIRVLMVGLACWYWDSMNSTHLAPGLAVFGLIKTFKK
jgi:hypothetical protein